MDRARCDREEAHERPASSRLLGALVVFVVLAFVFGSCGISLGAEEPASEIFEKLTIEGERTAGVALSLIIAYEQPYPGPARVTVECDLLEGDGNTKVADIHTEVLPENPTENLGEGVRRDLLARVTPEPGTIRTEFIAPNEPGRYLVRCFTVEDEDNRIQRVISIAPGPHATATS